MLSTRFLLLASFVALALSQGADLQESLDLDPSQVQPNQNNDGQDIPEAGQVPSRTSVNNFINFCATQSGVPLTNGLQTQGGSCNPTPMGRIIATSNMPRSKFVFPPNQDTSLVENQPFQIQMAIENLITGNFVNPNTNYYAAPATVNDAGILIGHSHVVIQALDSLDQTTIPDPNVFVFFKGFNTVADSNGILTANVTAGLPAGQYRMSSINAAANHQPALVAVAQHGSLDDFVYFTVNPAGGAAPPAAPPADPAAPAADPAAPSVDPAAPPVDPAAPPATPPASTTAAAAAAPSVTNFQAFQGSLGGVKANPVNPDASGSGFVTGGQTFAQKDDAVVNSCNTQRNACADKANAVNGAGGVTITACDLQQQGCLALATPPPDSGSKNLQIFNGTLGGIFAPTVFPSNGTFVTSGKVVPDLKDALFLSCSVQRNLCADKANAVNGANGVTIDACDQQQSACDQNAAAN